MRLIKWYTVIFLLIAAVSLHAQQEMPLMVGVADTNGVIMPFAVFNGNQWSNPWPQDEYDGTARMQPENVYTTLDHIPKSWYEPLNEIPETWNTVQPDGKTGIINISQPALVFSHCFQRWALIGKLSEKVNVGRMGDFYRLSQHIFLATTAQQTGSNIMIPDQKSGEYREVYTFIDSAISTSENSESPIPLSDREAVETELLYIARNEKIKDGSYIYYVEAKKDYVDNSSDPCISYFSGWIVRNSDNELSFISHDFKVYRHEGMYVSSDHALGIFILDGRSYWIIRDRAYEGESWLILDVSPSGIIPVLDVSGGGC